MYSVFFEHSLRLQTLPVAPAVTESRQTYELTKIDSDMIMLCNNVHGTLCTTEMEHHPEHVDPETDVGLCALKMENHIQGLVVCLHDVGPAISCHLATRCADPPRREIQLGPPDRTTLYVVEYCAVRVHDGILLPCNDTPTHDHNKRYPGTVYVVRNTGFRPVLQHLL